MNNEKFDFLKKILGLSEQSTITFCDKQIYFLKLFHERIYINLDIFSEQQACNLKILRDIRFSR